MLSPERIRATTGGIVFLLHPFRFSDTSVNNPSIVGSASHCNRSSPLHKGAKGDTALSTLPKPHFPLKSTISLPPLSKGGGLTARHKLLLCCVLLAICPLFLYCKLFCRQDGGIATPLAPSMRFSTPSLEKHYVLASPRKRGGGLTALQNRYSISSSFCNLPNCFQNCYTFAVKTVGIAPHPHHQ